MVKRCVQKGCVSIGIAGSMAHAASRSGRVPNMGRGFGYHACVSGTRIVANRASCPGDQSVAGCPHR